jgi:Clathrin adaptor complex small chain
VLTKPGHKGKKKTVRAPCYLFLYLLDRYASLYFCMCIDNEDNELEILEIIHHLVEILDRYFGSVS